MSSVHVVFSYQCFLSLINWFSYSIGFLLFFGSIINVFLLVFIYTSFRSFSFFFIQRFLVCWYLFFYVYYLFLLFICQLSSWSICFSSFILLIIRLNHGLLSINFYALLFTYYRSFSYLNCFLSIFLFMFIFLLLLAGSSYVFLCVLHLSSFSIFHFSLSYCMYSFSINFSRCSGVSFCYITGFLLLGCLYRVTCYHCIDIIFQQLVYVFCYLRFLLVW